MDVNLGKLWDGEEQEGLVCCSPWGHKESDMTEWLNNKLPYFADLLWIENAYGLDSFSDHIWDIWY